MMSAAQCSRRSGPSGRDERRPPHHHRGQHRHAGRRGARHGAGRRGVGLFPLGIPVHGPSRSAERGGAVPGVQKGGRDHGRPSGYHPHARHRRRQRRFRRSIWKKEQNPFLGYRAIRICLDRTDLFLVQLRALLRAPYGDLRIMFPMISSVDECATRSRCSARRGICSTQRA